MILIVARDKPNILKLTSLQLMVFCFSCSKSCSFEYVFDKSLAVHANDSKVPFASGVDRHENIGEGEMGINAFIAIMSDPAFLDIPYGLYQKYTAPRSFDS